MFQRKGKEHIRYIAGNARKAWERSNGTVPLEACLIDAMKSHRDHIKRILDATDHYNKCRNESNCTNRGGYSALND
jgi:hypothetical protein